MSVLVEALSLIVPRRVLDVSYPGGTEAFMLKMCEPDIPARLVCADERLVSVSFAGAEEAQVVGAELLALGIVAVDDQRFVEMAFLDQHYGPTIPCDWLKWRRHRDGFTYCWQAGTEPGDMQAPAGWTPEQSKALTREDIREQEGRALPLARKDDGCEVWLDFQTGAVIESLAQRELDPADGPIPAPRRAGAATLTTETVVTDEVVEGRLSAVFREMLEDNGYRYERADADTLLLGMRDEHGSYAVMLQSDDVVDFVGVFASFGAFVPATRRRAVAEAIARVNMRLRVGGFDLDFDDGELRFRIGMDVEEGSFGRRMADNMLGCAMHTMGFWHEALMGVAFGGADPATVVEAVS